jgi:hypothetical protein
MEKLEIYLEEGYSLKIDKSCILALWEFNYTNVEIYDTEFEKTWNQLVGDDIAEGFQLDEILYTDESREIETGYTLWTQFWERVQSPDLILLEVQEPLPVNNAEVEKYVEGNFVDYWFLVHKVKMAELVHEDFQQNAEWIKLKFQVKRDQ